MNEKELKQRTKDFALRVLKLVNALPNHIAGRKIGDQLLRAGTSVGANYRAACRGRSKAEFIAKLGIVEEEADESVFWLELIIEGELMKNSWSNHSYKKLTSWLRYFPLRVYLQSKINKRNRKSKIENCKYV